MKTLLEKLDLSPVFDDVLNKAKIVLSEKIVSRRKDVKHVDLPRLLEEYGDGVFKVVLKSAKGLQYTLYLYKGFIVAAIMENDVHVRGKEALDNLVTSSDVFDVQVYQLPREVFDEIVGSEKTRVLEELISSLEEKTSKQQPVAPEAPIEVVKEEKTRSKPVLEEERIDLVKIRREIYDLIERLGYDVLDVKLEHRGEIVYIYVELAPTYQMALLDPESVLYAVLSYYLEKTRRYDVVVKSELRIAENSIAKILVKKEDFKIARIIGYLALLFNENNTPVKKIEYNVSGNTLIINVNAKKPVYPDIDLKEVIRSNYEKLKQIWGKDVLINIKMSRFSKITIP